MHPHHRVTPRTRAVARLAYEPNPRSASTISLFENGQELRSRRQSMFLERAFPPSEAARPLPQARNTPPSLTTGKPQPDFCPAGCGQACWLAAVSGMDPLPSTTLTQRPNQSFGVRESRESLLASVWWRSIRQANGRRRRPDNRHWCRYRALPAAHTRLNFADDSHGAERPGLKNLPRTPQRISGSG